MPGFFIVVPVPGAVGATGGAVSVVGPFVFFTLPVPVPVPADASFPFLFVSFSLIAHGVLEGDILC